MPRKPTVKDPVHDKLYGPAGNVISDFKKQRKELVTELTNLLQSTIEIKMSGPGFLGTVDLIGNNLFELKQYVGSLKEACSSITGNYPNEENDQPLEDLQELCDVTLEGVARSEEYLNQLKSFAQDLGKIKGHIYEQLQLLHTEI